MKYKNIFCSIFFTFLMTAFGSIFAKDTGNTQEMDMEQMREFLKKQGVGEDQIKQMEGIMGDAAGKQVEHDAAILEKEQQEFEAAYGNNPNAFFTNWRHPPGIALWDRLPGPGQISPRRAALAMCSAARNASAWMVMVGCPRPDVTRLLPSQMNRLGTSCVGLGVGSDQRNLLM
ncbi:MAG: hypothetical protein WBM36_16395 [Lysobacterales bacterium]